MARPTSASASRLGVVVLLLAAQGCGAAPHTTTLFTDAQVEFEHVVRPGSVVHVQAERLLWRRRKLRSRVRLSLDDGTLVAHGTVAGIGATLERGVRVD